MEKDIQEILLTEEQIQAKIRELGEILTAEYADKNPIVVGVLKGVAIFYADMIRQINFLISVRPVITKIFETPDKSPNTIFAARKEYDRLLHGLHCLLTRPENRSL